MVVAKKKETKKAVGSKAPKVEAAAVVAEGKKKTSKAAAAASSGGGAVDGGDAPVVAKTKGGAKSKGVVAAKTVKAVKNKKEQKVVPPVSEEKEKKVRLAKGAASLGRKKEAKRKLEASAALNAKSGALSGVMYLGRIPKGFHEKQMSTFFTQFGDVKRIKLFRSKQHHVSKGYAFIEFEAPEVAALVAGAMNGYLMMDKQLVAHVIPQDKLHKGMFLYKRNPAKVEAKKAKESGKMEVEEEGEADVNVEEEENKHDAEKPLTSAELAAAVKSLKQKQTKLRKLGINFDFFEEEPAAAPAPPAAPAAVVVEKKKRK